MDDRLRVRRLEALTDALEHSQCLGQRQPTLLEDGVERGARHVLHDEVELVALLVLLDDLNEQQREAVVRAAQEERASAWRWAVGTAITGLSMMLVVVSLFSRATRPRARSKRQDSH